MTKNMHINIQKQFYSITLLLIINQKLSYIGSLQSIVFPKQTKEQKWLLKIFFNDNLSQIIIHTIYVFRAQPFKQIIC